MHKNIEGYADPTAGMALRHVMKAYRERQKKRFADKNRLKIYVASRYAGDVDANVAAAIRYCRYVIEKGFMPVASHLLYPRILDDSDPAERELGLLFGLALLRDCQEVWVFGPVSSGMVGEIAEAKRLDKPVRYFKEVDEK